MGQSQVYRPSGNIPTMWDKLMVALISAQLMTVSCSSSGHKESEFQHLGAVVFQGDGFRQQRSLINTFPFTEIDEIPGAGAREVKQQEFVL